METKTKRLISYVFLALLVASVLVYGAYFESAPDHRLKVDFYNVGQGDAMFIQTAQGTQMLLDGGPSSAVIGQLGRDLPFFDRTIDVIMLSHPHMDHVNGLIEVLKRYHVKKVLLPDVEFDSEPYKEFLKLVDEEHVEKVYVHEGMRIYLDDSTVFDVYYPPIGTLIADDKSDGFVGNKRNPNDVSIVGKLSFGHTRFLFTGDAGKEIEDMLLPKYNLDSDVLKVGHHGSKYSTSEELLKEVTPAYSVIEVGKNNYGHPTQDVLDRLKASNSEIFRTDQGPVEFESDGFNIFEMK